MTIQGVGHCGSTFAIIGHIICKKFEANPKQSQSEKWNSFASNDNWSQSVLVKKL